MEYNSTPTEELKPAATRYFPLLSTPIEETDVGAEISEAREVSAPDAEEKAEIELVP